MTADITIYDRQDERNAAYVINSGCDTPAQRAENEQRLRGSGCRSFKHVPYDPGRDPYNTDIAQIKALRTLGFVNG